MLYRAIEPCSADKRRSRPRIFSRSVSRTAGTTDLDRLITWLVTGGTGKRDSAPSGGRITCGAEADSSRVPRTKAPTRVNLISTVSVTAAGSELPAITTPSGTGSAIEPPHATTSADVRVAIAWLSTTMQAKGRTSERESRRCGDEMLTQMIWAAVTIWRRVPPAGDIPSRRGCQEELNDNLLDRPAGLARQLPHRRCEEANHRERGRHP